MKLELTSTAGQARRRSCTSPGSSRAFVRAGIPILDAVQVLGEEPPIAAVQRVLAEIEEDLRAGATFVRRVRPAPQGLPRLLPRHPAVGRADRRARHGARPALDLHGARPRGPAQDQGAHHLPGDRRRDVAGHRRVLAGFVLPKFEDFFASLDAELPLPTRMLLAITGFLTHTGGSCSAVAVLIACSASSFVRTSRAGCPATGCCCGCRSSVRPCGTRIVERFCRILASMVGAGVAAAARR